MLDMTQISKRLDRIPELEAELATPATASNQKLYRELLQEHSALKKLQQKVSRYGSILKDVEDHRELSDESTNDPELAELARSELVALEAELPDAEQALMVALLPPDPDDQRDSIMEIRAGTGGNEAALFAGDLFRMYTRFADEKGWKTGIIDASPSEIGGYKEIVFSVKGDDVYADMRYEMGVHRVQRVPVTETSGRIHTSAATVAVFPEAEANDNLDLNPEELRIDIYCASGPGGQSVNTTYSAVRVTHIPTGLVAQSQDERSQHRNKDKAMSVLKARILDHRKREEAEKRGDARRNQIGSGDRSERVRTYNFPQNRLTDHRINLTLYSLDRVIEGDIGELVTALREHDVQLRLQEELDG